MIKPADIGLKEPTPIIDSKKLLLTAEVDTSIVVEKPPTILSIKEQQATQTIYKRILSLGNFSVIKGKKKARKTFFLVMVSGNLLKPKDINSKLISDLPANKQLVLYFDTEQGEYDSFITMTRIQRLAGHKNHFKGFNLRQFEPLQRCEIIETALKEWGQNVGYVVIDGVRDLVTAINDELEATRVVSLFLRWTKEYNCHISTIIHENKATGDSRGHIGTEVENKSEIIIKVEKIKDDWTSSDVSCEHSRGIDFEGFRMTIQDGLPYVSDYIPEIKEPQKSYYDVHIGTVTDAQGEKIEIPDQTPF